MIYRERYSGSAIAFIFIVWPVWAVVKAGLSYRSKWAKNVIWVFCCFYGPTFVFTEGGDANRYREWFVQSSLSSGIEKINNFSLAQGNYGEYIDIGYRLINEVLSLFTSDYRVLFLVFGFIFGYFYSRNIWFLLDKINGKMEWHLCILVLAFLLAIPFWSINNFRFWVAAHIFIFGVLNYIETKKIRYICISIISVLFHFSYSALVVSFMFYCVLPQRLVAIYILFVCSYCVRFIDYSYFVRILSFFPAFIYERYIGYIDLGLREQLFERLSNNSWHAIFFIYSIKIALFILMSFLIFRAFFLRIRNNYTCEFLYFSMALCVSTNILSILPWCERFHFVSIMLMLAGIIIEMNVNKFKGYSIVLTILSPLIIFFCIVQIRTGFDYIGLFTIFGNPFSIFWAPGEIALINIIKG